LEKPLVFLKTVPKGASISYATTWTASVRRVSDIAWDMPMATTLLSNKSSVLIGGRAARHRRVTMDMMMSM